MATILYPSVQQPVTLPDAPDNQKTWRGPFSEPVRNKDAQAFIARMASGQVFDPFPLGTPEFIGPDKWWQPFGERLYAKPGLPAYLQHSLEWVQPALYPKDYGISWFAPLSLPKKLTPPRLETASQHYFEMQPTPIIAIGWFNWLSEPKRFPKAVLAGDQPFASEEVHPEDQDFLGWYQNFSTPKRFPKRLDPTLNPFFTTGAHALGTPFARGYVIC